MRDDDFDNNASCHDATFNSLLCTHGLYDYCLLQEQSFVADKMEAVTVH